MSTRGFEFAYMLDGSNATPLIRDFRLSTQTAHKVGDIMGIETDGDLTALTASIDEVTGIMQEAVASVDVDAGTTLAKVAIITRNQVWRASMDSGSTDAVVGTKLIDVANAYSIDADDLTNGTMCLVDTVADSAGTLVAYVVFTDTTFGNA